MLLDFGNANGLLIWADLVETPGVYTGTATKVLTVHAVDNLPRAGPTGFVKGIPGGEPARFRCKFVRWHRADVHERRQSDSRGRSHVDRRRKVFPKRASGALGRHRSFDSDRNRSYSTRSRSPGHIRTNGILCRVRSPLTSTLPNSAVGAWDYAGTDGFHLSIWTLTVSNGTITTTSDPVTLIALFGALGNSLAAPTNVRQGVPFALVQNFVPNWQIIGTRRQRVGALPPPRRS